MGSERCEVRASDFSSFVPRHAGVEINMKIRRVKSEALVSAWISWLL